jgi:hypothetical protein
MPSRSDLRTAGWVLLFFILGLLIGRVFGV